MIIPKTDTLYLYQGKKYILRAQKLFCQVYVQDDPDYDKISGSHFYVLNWWKFILFAKFIKTIKMSKVY